MKKYLSLLLAFVMAFSMMSFASAEEAPAGEVKTASAQGFASEVKVEATVADGKIVALTVDDSAETYASAGIQRADSVEKKMHLRDSSASVSGAVRAVVCGHASGLPALEYGRRADCSREWRGD